MSLLGSVRENWRVGLLVVIVALSTAFLFAPGFDSAASADNPTNLQYGLELDGGTEVRAPLVGVTAEGVSLPERNESFGSAEVEAAVAGEIRDVAPREVTVRYTSPSRDGGPATGVVEVTAASATQTNLETALSTLDYEFETVREGVTQQTLDETVSVLKQKINEGGLSGGTVRTIDLPGARPFVSVQVPGSDRSEVLDIVNSRGAVRVVAYQPVRENGTTTYVNETIFTDGALQRIGSPREGQGNRLPSVQVRIAGSDAARVQQTFVETGVAQRGGTRCSYPDTADPCLLVVRDGRVVNSFGMSPGLAQGMVDGEWQDDPSFVLRVNSFEEAQQVSIDLRAGALPAALNVDEGTTRTTAPAQGADFKRDSLIAGILAVFAVSGVVFLRYGEAEVALPMIVTAMAEVYALLGLAALIQYPVDLSVIGGFIAVIGTGVDDLIIIANEVMDEGDVQSRRVFQSRFRKAFWVIGAAAATTVIAMSPLAVLSLGDLQGFAIFTILGVFVGVFVTRPAYGDILRSLLTDR
ncbi:preprotein translocase subunit SecD [Halobaculum sp. MBLA0143]|uniref:preprotein translocase subunit SecD n=1 Tax=Halobaculum sp. MBLA0143 TaxID=3079933 RepID=UPI003525CE0E